VVHEHNAAHISSRNNWLYGISGAPTGSSRFAVTVISRGVAVHRWSHLCAISVSDMTRWRHLTGHSMAARSTCTLRWHRSPRRMDLQQSIKRSPNSSSLAFWVVVRPSLKITNRLPGPICSALAVYRALANFQSGNLVILTFQLTRGTNQNWSTELGRVIAECISRK
jgi:hypothetical protein